MYATGSRSHEGIAALLSGYPTQTNKGVILYPQKSQNLPSLCKKLEAKGYQSAFYYGGDLNYANLKSYFISTGFDTLITIENFTPEECNSKWGAHDHVVLNRMLNNLNQTTQPFFNVCFTLSSHPPYDVPMETIFTGSDSESKFFNSLYYTDRSIADFVAQAKMKTWWNNTIIILIADHGVTRPGNLQYHEPRKFHIPMLWIGGAISAKDSIIECFATQNDLPLTLLMQLDTIDKYSEFKFGRNIFSHNSASFAYYLFDDGFGYLTPDFKIIFDNQTQTLRLSDGKFDKSNINKGKALLQMIHSDFNGL